jgi:hypothetical protein
VTKYLQQAVIIEVQELSVCFLFEAISRCMQQYNLVRLVYITEVKGVAINVPETV